MSRDIIDLAISMTEIDTGTQLPLEEREAMRQRILAKIENINQQCAMGAEESLIFLFYKKPFQLYNDRYV